MNDYYKQHTVTSVETPKMSICLEGAYSLMAYYLRRHEYSLVIDKIPAVFFEVYWSLIQGVTNKNQRYQHWIPLHFSCQHPNYSIHYSLPHP